MEKECSCKKLIKEDKVTLIYECKVCIKKRRKDTKLLLSVLDKLIELKKLSIPKYKTGGKHVELIANDPSKNIYDNYMNEYKGWVVCDGKNTSVKDWLESLKPKADFNKQMLEADKELQRVCENSELKYYVTRNGVKTEITKPYNFD